MEDKKRKLRKNRMKTYSRLAIGSLSLSLVALGLMIISLGLTFVYPSITTEFPYVGLIAWVAMMINLMAGATGLIAFKEKDKNLIHSYAGLAIHGLCLVIGGVVLYAGFLGN